MDKKLHDSITWLEMEAHRIIRAAKRTMHDGTSAFPPQVGIHYEAFWLRDYEYTLEGSISSYSNQELLAACRLFIKSMDSNGAGTDCVQFDGTPIYKPGYGSMGTNPVADGSQFTVGVAWHTYQKTKDPVLLTEILDPLVKTMKAVHRNPKTGLVHIDPNLEWDRCPYGFTDSVRKTGDELFCSLLYVQACRQLADLMKTSRRSSEGDAWQAESFLVGQSIRDVFWDADFGLFRAATIRCREHDIWGSAFAVYLNVADTTQARAIASYFSAHYGELVQHGQIRQLPAGIYWEKTETTPDTYQNGAFWATPTGWFAYTLDLINPRLANQVIIDMVEYFRQHGAHEWIFGESMQLPNYLASASLPLDGIRAMLIRRKYQEEGAATLRVARTSAMQDTTTTTEKNA